MTEVVRPVGVMRARVQIRTYPRDDEAFERHVLEQLRRFDRVRHAGAIPARLELLLRERYPRARSRYQDPLAASDELPLLYVFRDGGVLGADDGDQAGPEAAKELALSGGSDTAA